MYLPLTSCLSALDLPNYLDNRGHPAICRALMQMGCAGKETFILLSDIDEVGNTGRWISKRCLLALLRNDQIFQRKSEQKTVFFRLLKKFKLPDKLPSPGNTVSDSDTNTCSDSDSIFSDDNTSSPGNDITVTPISGKVNVNSKMTTYIVESGKVWVEIRMFPFLQQHINKRAFHFIDEALSREGLYPESCFRTTSRRYKRSHVHTKALHTILDHCFSHRKQECLTAKSLLDDIKDAIICNLIEKQACKANTRPVPDSEKLSEFVHEELGSKKDFLKAMSCLVKPVSLSGPSALFLNKEDLSSLLDLASNCPTKIKLVTEAVACYYRKKHMFTAEELLHIEENFSGVRLMDALRKKMPGIMPSLAQERKYRKASRTAFRATLLPRKCATGYYIDPRRLLEVLLHKYHFLEDTITLRLWGDGREIGGRHCVVIGMSVISHDLKLHGLSYHDPRDVYPIMMCYEGDSRDNLEENLGVKGFLESFISDLPKNIQVLLCGDHMFLQNILGADEDKLSPTSDEGWNLYSCTSKEHKKVVAKTGLRTDVPQKFDRLQPNSLLPSIPNKHVVFCLLHATARIVEKLVNLEIEIIHVNANTLGQTNTAPLNKEDLLANLEANINRRDVQQGNFRVHFDKSGKPEPVKFNKDAAMAIISPAPPGKEADYPHVLSNVLFQREAQINMTKAAKKYLDIPDTATDIHLVSLIWESMYQMLSILKSDPDPVLLEGRPEGSVHVQDYKWGYSADQLQSYKFHAERFYQLYCARYKWHNLTPYMCKLVDYALYFMNDLPVPIVRCQAEAGEHANYLHGNIFYSHTTRHGGKYNVDPIVSIFETTWRRLCHDISGKKGEPAEDFAKYVTRHTAAVTIQRAWRGFRIRKRLKQVGFNLCVASEEERQCMKHIADRELNSFHCDKAQNRPLSGLTFVLAGTIPKLKNKKFTRADLTQSIVANGGKVRMGFPGKKKSRSTKKFVLLYHAGGKTKTPAVVRDSLRRGYPVVTYDYVLDCVNENQRLDTAAYIAILPNVKSVTREPVLQCHYRSKQRFISMVKSKRKKTAKKAGKIINMKNPAVLYASERLSLHEKVHDMTFRQWRQLYVTFLKKYSHLSASMREFYRKKWMNKKLQLKAQQQREDDLKTYNFTKPAYSLLT